MPKEHTWLCFFLLFRARSSEDLCFLVEYHCFIKKQDASSQCLDIKILHM